MKNLTLQLMLVVWLLAIPSGSEARQYFVHYVKGRVSVVHDGQQTVLREKSYVDDKDRLIVGKGSGVILIQGKHTKLPIIKGPTDDRVKRIVKAKSTSWIEYPAEFVRFVLGKSHSEARLAEAPDGMKATGSITRSFSVRQLQDGKRVEESQTYATKDELLDLMERMLE